MCNALMLACRAQMTVLDDAIPQMSPIFVGSFVYFFLLTSIDRFNGLELTE